MSKQNSIGRIVPKSCKALVDAMEKAGGATCELQVQLLNVRKDGSSFLNMLAPLSDGVVSGQVPFIMRRKSAWNVRSCCCV